MGTEQRNSPPLRGAAEAELARRPGGADEAPQRSAEALLHELQVHQIELEMQNESLRQVQADLEVSRDRYLDLYDFAPVAYLTLDPEAAIAAINLTGALLLGEDRSSLIRRPFVSLVLAEDRDLWHRHWHSVHRSAAGPGCELRLRRRDGSVFAAGLECRQVVIGAAPPELRITLSDISARWAAEKALAESESRFRLLADAAPVLIWMADADRRRVWFNRHWLEFTGNATDACLGDGWTQLLHREDLDRYRQIDGDAWARQQGFEAEYRLRHGDGEYRWVIERGRPRHSADGEFLGYLGCGVDVTGLKRVEEDLTRAQSVGHIGSWRFDARRQRFSLSREAQRIFGLGEGEPATSAALLARVHPEDAGHVEAAWRAGAGGEAYDIEHRLLVDGRVRWVHEKAELEFDAQGQLASGFGITQDITELKLARLELLESRERFDAFMTHSSVAAWIVDASGRFEYASPTFRRIFRLAVADVTGQLLEAVYPPAVAAAHRLAKEAAWAAAQPVESVETAERADGSSGEFLVVRFPIRDRTGRALLGGMALDITERRQAVAQLNLANERLKRLAGERALHLRELAGELLRTEQHERDRLYERLHDDMQPLLVAARLALSSLGGRSRKAACLQVAAESCDYLGQVIEMARNLSLQLSPPLIRERGLIAALEALSLGVCGRHGLKVELHCTADAEPDDLALRLLCFNAVRELLINVAKHAGVAEVSLRVERHDGDQLRLTVADRGRGFNADAGSGGSGLAAIERRLAMFGGTLAVASRPGEGTVASVGVPLNPPAADGRGPGLREGRRNEGAVDAANPHRR